MLLTLMYHRIGKGKHTNALPMLRSHLSYIKNRFEVVLPGDPLPKKKIAICLTFDDATYDFYHYVYPVLRELELRVVLGIPVGYILPSSSLSAEERLNIPYSLMMQDGIFEKKAPFCTWEEISEMIHSGHVQAASHSFSHPNLTFPFVNLEKELKDSKKVIETHLSQVVTTFIYPFGRFSSSLHKKVSSIYPYSFRIGSAFNRNWNSQKKPLCRVPADHLSAPDSLFRPLFLFRYYMRSFL